MSYSNDRFSTYLHPSSLWPGLIICSRNIEGKRTKDIEENQMCTLLNSSEAALVGK